MSIPQKFLEFLSHDFFQKIREIALVQYKTERRDFPEKIVHKLQNKKLLNQTYSIVFQALWFRISVHSQWCARHFSR